MNKGDEDRALKAHEALSYLFVLRFPLVSAAALFAVPLLYRRIPSLLSLSGAGAALATGQALLISWAIAFAARVLIEAAPRRFAMPELTVPRRIARYRIAIASLPASPIIVAIVLSAHDVVGAFAMAACGIAGALAVLWIAVRGYRLLDASDAFMVRRLRWLWRSTAKEEEGREVYSHSIFLVALFLIATAACVIGVIRPEWRLGTGRALGLQPTLIYLELLLFHWAMLLSLGSLFLDRYRVPVSIAVVASMAAALFLVGSRHFFVLTRARCADSANRRAAEDCSAPVPVSEAVEPWLQSEQARSPGRKPVMMVVATSGGGIHAAAWTARVLTGLEEELGVSFIRSIRLLSSASGGSVGVLYFVSSYEPELGAPAPEQLRYINQAARTSCDEAVAWGLLRASLMPWSFPLIGGERDRGMALEQLWNQAMPWRGRAHSISAALSEWRTGVREGWRAATVFNATVIETNQAMLFSTVEIPPASTSIIFGEGKDGFPGADIDVLTAVRLSASFAWVSPLARARFEGKDKRAHVGHFHVGDAGYYDAYGMESALDWASAVFRNFRDRLGGIVIIQIRDEPYDTPADRGLHFAQVFGPIVASLDELINVQFQRNQADMARARSISGGFIDTVVFAPRHPSSKAWSLAESQKSEIDSDWEEVKRGSEMRKLRELAQLPPASSASASR